jgi:hypothetical protein
VLWGPDESHMAREIALGLPGASALLAPPHRSRRPHGASPSLPAHDRQRHGTTPPRRRPRHALSRSLGPTSAERNGPYGPACRGLQSTDGSMAGLGVDLVFDAARAVLEGAA